MRTKMKALIAGAAAVGIIGAGAVAYAAFGYSPVADAAGSAESFKAVTVTVPAGTKALLPGESDNVILKIENPNNGNAKAKVVAITGVGVDVLQSSTSANTPEAKAYCESKIAQKVNDPSNVTPLPTLSGGTSQYTLNNGVAFASDMDSTCEGITFTTKWKVEFQAVRS